MTLRRPLARINGVTKELPAGDTLPTLIPAGGGTGQVLAKNSGADYDLIWTTAGAFKLFASSGDLSVTPSPLITFSGLIAANNILLDLSNVTHDFSSSQALGVSVSFDGTNFGPVILITGSFAAGVYVSGGASVIGAAVEKPVLQAITVTTGTSPLSPPSAGNANSNLARILHSTAGNGISVIRVVTVSGGNLNRGFVRCWTN